MNRATINIVINIAVLLITAVAGVAIRVYAGDLIANVLLVIAVNAWVIVVAYLLIKRGKG